MSEVSNKSKIDMCIILTYMGSDGLNRHRNIDQSGIGEETLSFKTKGGTILPPLHKVVCDTINELEAFVMIEKERENVDDLSSIKYQAFKFKINDPDRPVVWHDKFKNDTDAEGYQDSLFQRTLFCLIQRLVIERLFLGE